MLTPHFSIHSLVRLQEHGTDVDGCVTDLGTIFEVAHRMAFRLAASPSKSTQAAPSEPLAQTLSQYGVYLWPHHMFAGTALPGVRTSTVRATGHAQSSPLPFVPTCVEIPNSLLRPPTGSGQHSEQRNNSTTVCLPLAIAYGCRERELRFPIPLR